MMKFYMMTALVTPLLVQQPAPMCFKETYLDNQEEYAQIFNLVSHDGIDVRYYAADNGDWIILYEKDKDVYCALATGKEFEKTEK